MSNHLKHIEAITVYFVGVYKFRNCWCFSTIF